MSRSARSSPSSTYFTESRRDVVVKGVVCVRVYVHQPSILKISLPHICTHIHTFNFRILHFSGSRNKKYKFETSRLPCLYHMWRWHSDVTSAPILWPSRRPFSTVAQFAVRLYDTLPMHTQALRHLSDVFPPWTEGFYNCDMIDVCIVFLFSIRIDNLCRDIGIVLTTIHAFHTLKCMVSVDRVNLRLKFRL